MRIYVLILYFRLIASIMESVNLVSKGLVICCFIVPYMQVWHICWWQIGLAGLYLWSSFSHFIIDLIKCKCYQDSLSTFLADQFLHIATIGILWFVLYGDGTVLSYIENHCSVNVWLTVVAYILMLRPSSILLGLFLNKWTPVSSNTQSLPNAGQWIGYIERIMILTFVLVGSFEGVGFLLAAKSVFRFGELNKAKEIRTTEYVLIGTFSSFTIAILTGIAIRSLF